MEKSEVSKNLTIEQVDVEQISRPVKGDGQMLHEFVGYQNIANFSFEKLFEEDPTQFTRSKFGFWINESEMNDHIAMRYTLNPSNSLEELLSSDLNKLNTMKQPDMVFNQFCMLLEDLDNTVSGCLVSRARRASFPPDSTRIIEYPPGSTMRFYGGFYDNLFISPLTLKIERQNSEGRNKLLSDSSVSRERKDLCDIFDDVHLKNGGMKLFD